MGKEILLFSSKIKETENELMSNYLEIRWRITMPTYYYADYKSSENLFYLYLD